MEAVDLRRYLDILKRHRFTIVMTVLAAAIAAALLSSLRVPQYQATAQVLLHPDQASVINPDSPNQAYTNPQLADRYVTAQIRIVTSEAVAKGVADELGGDADELVGKVSVKQSTNSDILNVSATDIDPAEARAVANAFANAYIVNRRDYAVANIERTTDELETKLGELQDRIAELDARIAFAGADPGASALPTPVTPPPVDEGASDPAALGAAPESTSDTGGLPTTEEAMKTARYSAAVQYESLYARQQELLVEKSLKRGDGELIAEAKTPTSPVSPKPLRDGVLGGMLGLLLGVGWVFFRDKLDDRIRSREDAEAVTSLPVLGALPVEAGTTKESRRIAVVEDPRGALSEAVRTLRTNINFIALEQPARRIVVTSAVPSEGKSFVAVNLAAAYAQTGTRTLLVSSDLRRPRLDEMLGLRGAAGGLTSLFQPSVAPARVDVSSQNGGSGNGWAPRPAGGSPLSSAIEDAVVGLPGVDNLFILPAGELPPNPAELLGSRRMGELLEGLSAFAEMVIFDAPPVLAVTDAAVLGARCDGTILVAAEGETRRGALDEAKDTLEQAKLRLLGVVLNKSQTVASGYYRYGYYGEAPERSTRRSRKRKAAESPNGNRPNGPGNDDGNRGRRRQPSRAERRRAKAEAKAAAKQGSRTRRGRDRDDIVGTTRGR